MKCELLFFFFDETKAPILSNYPHPILLRQYGADNLW